ncbi:hypothetical protein NG798_26125 [Ancylothrix sp. C2]|nr:hypothetical protein [Ancylothrix sp. D3o]
MKKQTSRSRIIQLTGKTLGLLNQLKRLLPNTLLKSKTPPANVLTQTEEAVKEIREIVLEGSQHERSNHFKS